MATSNSTFNAETGRLIEVVPGQLITLEFQNTDDVRFFQQDGSLLISPADGNGAQILLQDFFVIGDTEEPAVVSLQDGTQLSIDEIIGLVENFDPDLIAPAAGGAAGTGGGAGFGAYGDDGIGDGIGVEDLLPPTELEFALAQDEEIAIIPIVSETKKKTTFGLLIKSKPSGENEAHYGGH